MLHNVMKVYMLKLKWKSDSRGCILPLLSFFIIENCTERLNPTERLIQSKQLETKQVNSVST